jgi:hypothetical protein
MSTPRPERTPPRTAVVGSVVWILVVTATWCVTYGLALVRSARAAAERFPFIERLLDLLHLGA